MYYLLEDNRIVDSENIRESIGLPNHISAKIDDVSKEVIIENTFAKLIINVLKIKKQSENVFDLIEKGDLVNTIVDSIYQVVIIAKNVVIAPQLAFDLAEVTAIYKPDSKGNYIKVWENKDE